MTSFSASAYKFDYTFHETPVSEAIVRISKDHPDINISFIYKELGNYRTSAVVHTDNAYDALRTAIGLNPVSVIRKGNDYYIEALQHGKFVYTGTAVGDDREPVAAATVMLLAPSDSSVITYGIADAYGRFSIPCDRRGVITKLSCIGYKTTYRRSDVFNLGYIVMPINATPLQQVNVEGELATVYSDKTVFIPTSRQKNASQTGADLIDHIGIPQLKVSLSGGITTNAGGPVTVFIDYLPANADDLNAKRIDDVRRVEYYEYSSDPRLQGNPYVVNFVMARYEYGGYAKAYGLGTFLNGHQEQMIGNVRMQYKRMTYDLVGSTYDNGTSHIGQNMSETFRLTQDDGSVKQFNRFSELESSKRHRNNYYLIFKATYNSDKVQASTLINSNLDRQPNTVQNGKVRYSGNAYPTSEYSSTTKNFSKFISYSGYYFLALPYGNTLTFTPTYKFSHTEQNSSYLEKGFNPIFNNASDNTNQFKAELKFTHNFDGFGQILGFVRGNYEHNRTRYSGSVESFDRAKTSRLGAGINYSVTIGDLRCATGFGWDWDRLQFSDIYDKPSNPWFDLSLQYSMNKKHSLSTVFHYSTWAPDPSFKSENVISATPLLSYTGNPALVPDKAYDLGIFYNWFPNNNYNVGAFATTYIAGDRYVYDYEASSTGILRTIRQPMGKYSNSSIGANATVRFLDRTLVFDAQATYTFNHNGKPYNINHSQVSWHARARYYLNNWHFALTYISDNGRSDQAINGNWTKTKNDWYITAGWSNSYWNIQAIIMNMTRWHWRGDIVRMRSKYYDTTEQAYDGQSHALLRITATYTFGFGKKVTRDNEPSISGSASSGILK